MQLPRDQRRMRVWLSFVLVVVTLALYFPVVHHQFLPGWDDDDYVTENPHIRSGLTVDNLRWAFSSFDLSNWHPVTWLSHMADCQFFGLNPAAHHLINLLLHAANVLLLFWLLALATDTMWRSFFVALLFAVHPLNVETVAWVAQRKSLLSLFFSLLALAAYGWYVRRGGWPRYLLIVASFSLALMAKPMAVTLPLLMLLLDYWPLQRFEELAQGRRWARLLVEKIPLFAMSAISSFLTEKAQAAGGSVMQTSMLPVSIRFENAAISCIKYVGKILWPTRLSTYYPLTFSPAAGDAIASAAIVIAISALVLYFRRTRFLCVGWFLFLVALVPVIGVVQVGFQGMADRYTYVPAIGLFIAVVWGASAAVATVRPARIALEGVAAVAIIALTFATATYLKAWDNSAALFAHARVAWGRPDFWLEQLYGNALLAQGRSDEALDHYEESCRLQPRTEYCHYGIARILAGHGQFAEAVGQYQLALQFTANRAMALRCLEESAEAELQMGNAEAARRSAIEALTLDPSDAAALRLLQQSPNK